MRFGANGSSAKIGVPILPPICTSRPALCRICAVRYVVVDLPLVPVMATNGAAGAVLRTLAAEQLDVADDLDPGFARLGHHPMRLRMGERHARRQHQRRHLRPVDVAQVSVASPAACASAIFAASSSKQTTLAPPAFKRCGADEPGIAEAEHGHPFAGEDGDRDHRSFKVASPASASTTATIQNRITICGSVQPSCS